MGFEPVESASKMRSGGDSANLWQTAKPALGLKEASYGGRKMLCRACGEGRNH